jgi:hypothetical protein
VDPESKRLLKYEKYHLVEGEYQFVSRFEFDYDEDPAAQVFALNLPPDVITIDQTSKEIGVPRNGLSDNDLAVKVARDFFEAMIARDYATAGRIAEGIPADMVKKYFGGTEYIRIISVGTPFPHADLRTEFLCVPCEVEVRDNGVTEVKTLTLNIRHAYNQPDRWVVGGGI